MLVLYSPIIALFSLFIGAETFHGAVRNSRARSLLPIEASVVRHVTLSSTSLHCKAICSGDIPVESALQQYITKEIPRLLQVGGATESSCILRERQGLPFSLGCSEWKSSGYIGNIQCWAAAQTQEVPIHWLSLSTVTAEESTSGSAAAPGQDSPLWRTDLQALSLAASDVPHLRLSIGSYTGLGDDGTHSPALFAEAIRKQDEPWLKIKADFIPRRDLLTDIAYFDKYFMGFDDDLFRCGIRSLPSHGADDAMMMPTWSPLSTLERMMSSPFETSVWINSKNPQPIFAICDIYIQRWVRWILENNIPSEPDQQLILRDESVRRLLFDENKFSIARILGADFAPKAESLAASIMGPVS